MHTIRDSFDNTVIKKHIDSIAEEITKGYALSSIMQRHSVLFTPDVVAIITIGEESSSLGLMFSRLALHYKEQLNKKLSIITTVIQPVLMIILGLFITFLIFAVYMPVFNLSYAIT